MTEPVTINKAEAIANARKAYEENRLQVQHPVTDPTLPSGCLYRTPEGHCCVIGASLDDDTAYRFDTINLGGTVGVSSLLADGHITSDDPEFLKRMQKAHDSCHLALDPEKQKLYGRELCELLGVEYTL